MTDPASRTMTMRDHTIPSPQSDHGAAEREGMLQLLLEVRDFINDISIGAPVTDASRDHATEFVAELDERFSEQWETPTPTAPQEAPQPFAKAWDLGADIVTFGGEPIVDPTLPDTGFPLTAPQEADRVREALRVLKFVFDREEDLSQESIDEIAMVLDQAGIPTINEPGEPQDQALTPASPSPALSGEDGEKPRGCDPCSYPECGCQKSPDMAILSGAGGED